MLTKFVKKYRASLLVIVAVSLFFVTSCSSTTEPEEGFYPTNLRIEKQANSRIKLTWDFQYNVNDTISFQVDKKTGLGSWNLAYATVDDESQLLVDYISTTDSLAYAYRVKAYNYTTDEESTYSEVIAYLSEYTYPTDLDFNQNSQDQVTISWVDHCVGEDGYIIDKQVEGDAWEEDYLILPPDAMQVTDQIDLFQESHYRIYAYVGTSRTEYLSDSLFATLLPPSELTAISLDQNKIRLNWIDNSTGEEGFYIDRQIGELPWELTYAQVNAEDTTFVDDITISCASLKYRVRAFHENNTSDYSEVCSINVLLNIIGEYNPDGVAIDVYLPVENTSIPEWTAFVSENYQGLAVVDCHNPTAPSVVANYTTLWGDRTLTAFVESNFAYVATQSLSNAAGGIQKVDISNLESPYVYNVTETQGIPKDLDVDGDFAYIAEGDAGISVMYIAGSTPNIFSYYDLFDARSLEMIVSDGSKFLLIANGLNHGMVILDVTDPQNILLVADYQIEGVACDIAIKNGYAFLANGEEGLEIINITDLYNPISVKTVQTNGFVNGVSADLDQVYLSDLENGIFVVDTQTPEDAYILGNLQMDSQPATIQLSGSYVYVTDDDNLKIIKVKP